MPAVFIGSESCPTMTHVQRFGYHCSSSPVNSTHHALLDIIFRYATNMVIRNGTFLVLLRLSNCDDWYLIREHLLAMQHFQNFLFQMQTKLAGTDNFSSRDREVNS